MWFWQEQGKLWEMMQQWFGPGRRPVIDGIDLNLLLAEGRASGLIWEEMAEVSIVTTNEGPLMDDVYFILQDGQCHVCALPQEAAVFCGLLSRLQQLPGFDNEQVIRAMGSTDNARFVCWRSEATPDPVLK